MTLLKYLLKFLTKEDYDFDSSDVDLFNFHPQLRIFFVPMGVFYRNRDSIIRFVWPTLCCMLSIVATVLEIIFIYHGMSIKDYSFSSECFCYFLMLGCIPIVYVAMLSNKQNILQLLDDMNEDFLTICSLGKNYRERFLNGQLLIHKLCYTWLIFCLFIVFLYISMTMGPLFIQSLFATQTEYTVRPLMFPMWLPEDDPYRTPNYEVFTFFQLAFCFIFIQTFCVYVYIQFHVLLHYYNLMDIVIMDIEVIFENLNESVVDLPRNDANLMNVRFTLNKRVQRIVKWQLSAYKCVDIVSSVYGPPLVYQVMITPFATCLMAYQVADKLDQGKLDILFAILLVAGCVQLWIPCYLGTLIKNKGFAIGDALWNCGWHKTSLCRMLCHDIVIIIHKSQQPLVISFTGLPQLQLETFTSIMSTAYSYFNMLRTYNSQ